MTNPTIPKRPSQSKAPEVEFIRLDDMKMEDDPETILIYGGSKSGKTWVLGTFGDRTLYVNTGDGIKTIKSPGFKAKVKSNPLVVNIREKLNIAGIPDDGNPKAFDLMCDTLDYAFHNFGDKFDAVAIDELSATRRHALFDALELSQAMGRSRTWDKTKQYEIILPAVQDFGAEMSLIEQFLAGTISLCKQHKKHLFIAAHQRYLLQKPRDAQGNIMIGEPQIIKEIRPAVTGAQFPDTVSGMFDNVWHMEFAGAYRVRTVGDSIIMAGSRHAGILPDVIVNPNLKEIIEHIKLGKPVPTKAKAEPLAAGVDKLLNL